MNKPPSQFELLAIDTVPNGKPEARAKKAGKRGSKVMEEVGTAAQLPAEGLFDKVTAPATDAESTGRMRKNTKSAKRKREEDEERLQDADQDGTRSSGETLATPADQATDTVADASDALNNPAADLTAGNAGQEFDTASHASPEQAPIRLAQNTTGAKTASDTAAESAAVLSSEDAAASALLKSGEVAAAGLGGGGLAVLGGVAIAAAAGGGGGGGGLLAALVVPGPQAVTLLGSVVLGPVVNTNGLIATAYNASGNVITVGGNPVTAQVLLDGSFSLFLGSYEGPVLVVVTDTNPDADYWDEATGAPKDLTVDQLRAAAVSPPGGGTIRVNVNVFTEAAVRDLLSDDGSGTSLLGVTAAQIQSANAKVTNALGLLEDIVTGTAPVAVVTPTGLPNTDANSYGRLLAAASGVDESFTTEGAITLLLAAVNDASNPVLATGALLLAGAQNVVDKVPGFLTNSQLSLGDYFFIADAINKLRTEIQGSGVTVENYTTLKALAELIGTPNTAVAPDPSNATGLYLVIGNGAAALADALGAPNTAVAPAESNATGLYLLIETSIAAAVAALQAQITSNDGDIALLISDAKGTLGEDDYEAPTTNSIAGLKAALAALEGAAGADVSALQTEVGAPAAGGNPATGLYLLIENSVKVVALVPTLSVVGPDLNDGVLESSEGDLVIRVSLPSGVVAGDSLQLNLNGIAFDLNGDDAEVAAYVLQEADITAGFVNITLTQGDLVAGPQAITATISSGSVTSNRSAGLFFDFTPDTAAPTVASIRIDSATGAQNNLLNSGDVVSVTATFSEAVTVVTTGGTPQLALLIGATTVQAGYVTGSGTNVLTFSYTILANQTDANGISIPSNAIGLNGGAIADLAGNAAVLTSSIVSDNSSFRVDTTPPTISVGTIAGDDVIDASERLSALVISGTTNAENGQLVTVVLNSRSYIGTVVNGTWSVVVDANHVAQLSNAGDASYAVTATVSDLAGNATTSASRALGIDFTIDYLTSQNQILSLLGSAALAEPMVDATFMDLPQLAAVALGAASVTGNDPIITGTFTITNQLSSVNIASLLAKSDADNSEITVNASGMNALQLQALGASIAKVDSLQNLTLTNAGLPAGAETLIGHLLGASAANSVTVNGIGMSVAELASVGTNISKVGSVTLSSGETLSVTASSAIGTVFNGGTLIVTGNVGPTFFNSVTLNNVTLDLRSATTVSNPLDLPATTEVIISAAQAEALTIVGRQTVDTVRIDVSGVPQHTVAETALASAQIDLAGLPLDNTEYKLSVGNEFFLLSLDERPLNFRELFEKLQAEVQSAEANFTLSELPNSVLLITKTDAGALPAVSFEYSEDNTPIGTVTTSGEVQTITISGNPKEVVISGLNGTTYFSKVVVLDGVADKALAIRSALNAADAFNTKVESVTAGAGGTFTVTFNADLGNVEELSVVTGLRVNIDTRGDDDRVIFDFGATDGTNQIALLGTLELGPGRTTIDSRSDIFEVFNGSVDFINAAVSTGAGSYPYQLVINSTVNITLPQLQLLISSGQLEGIAGRGTINVIGDFPAGNNFVIDLGAVFPVTYTPGGLTVPTINFVSSNILAANAVYLDPVSGKYFDDYATPDYTNEVFRGANGTFFSALGENSDNNINVVVMPIVGTSVRVTFNGENPVVGFGATVITVAPNTEVIVYTGSQLAAVDALSKEDKAKITKVTIASDIVLTADVDLTDFANVVYQKPDSSQPRVTVNEPAILTISADQLSGLTVNGTGTVVISGLNSSATYDFSKVTVTNVSVVITDVFNATTLQLGNLGFVVDSDIDVDGDDDNGLLTLTAAQASGRSIVVNNEGKVVITGLGSSFVDLSGVNTDGGGTATAAVSTNLTLNADTRLGDVNVTVATGRTLTLSASTADGATITGAGTGSVVITGLSGDVFDFRGINVVDDSGRATARVTSNVTLAGGTQLGEVILDVAAGRTLTLSADQAGARTITGLGSVVVTNLQINTDLSKIADSIHLVGSINESFDFSLTEFPADWAKIDAYVIAAPHTLTLTVAQANGKIITGNGTVIIVGEVPAGTTANFDGIDTDVLDISRVTLGENEEFGSAVIGPINVERDQNTNQTLVLTNEQRDALYGPDGPFPDGVNLNTLTIDSSFTVQQILETLRDSNAIITVDTTGMTPEQLKEVADGIVNVVDIVGKLTLTSALLTTEMDALLSKVVDNNAVFVTADAAGMSAAQLVTLASTSDPVNLTKIDSFVNLMLTDGNTANAATITSLLGSAAVKSAAVDLSMATLTNVDAFTLTVNGVTLSWADPADPETPPTVAQIVEGLKLDEDYNSAGFTIRADGNVIVIAYTALPDTPSVAFTQNTDPAGEVVNGGANVVATDMDEAKLAAVADGAAGVLDITGTLAISTVGLTSAQIGALLEQATLAATVIVDAAGMDEDDITAIAATVNLAKIDSIVNLTLTDDNTADAATIDRLLAVNAVKLVPLSRVDLTGAQLTGGVPFELVVGGVTLTQTVAGTPPTVADIVAGLILDDDYAAAGFTLTAVNDVIEIAYTAPATAPAISFTQNAAAIGTVITGGANVIATSMDAAKLNAVAVGIDAVIMDQITGVMSLNQGVLEANIPTLFGKYLGTGDDQALVNAQGMTAGQLIEVSEGIAEVQDDGITNLTITNGVIVSDTRVATGTVGGDNGSAGGPAVQTIAIDPAVLGQGKAFTLVLAGGVTLTATLNGATPSVADLLAAFQALDGYAASPVTLSINTNTITVTYKANGEQVAPQLLMSAADDGHIGRLLSKAVNDAVTVDITGMDNHQIEAVRDSVIKVGTMSSDKATIFEAHKTYWTIDGGQLTVDAVGGGTIKIFTAGTPDVDITSKFDITTTGTNNTSNFITYKATLKAGENLGAVQPTLVIKYLRDLNNDTDFDDVGETVTPTYKSTPVIIELPLIKPHIAALIDSLEIDILTITDTLTVEQAASLDIHNDSTPTIVYDVLDSIAAIQAVLDAGDPLRLLRDARSIDLTDSQPEAVANRLDIPASLASAVYDRFPKDKANWLNITPDLIQDENADDQFTYVEIGTIAKALTTLNIAVDDLDIGNDYTGAGNITTARVAITSGGRATDLLAVNLGSIFTTTYTGGTSMVVTVLSGQEANASAAAWSTMLNSLSFRSTSETPNVIGNIHTITTNSLAATANDLRTIDFTGVEVVVGGEYKVSLATNTFSYSAKTGDTLATIVDKLASLIHAHSSYTAEVQPANTSVLRVTSGAGLQSINVVGIVGTRTLEITVEDGAGARSAATVVNVNVESVNDQPTITYTMSGSNPREDFGNYKLFNTFTFTANELESNFNGAVLRVEIIGGRNTDVFLSYGANAQFSSTNIIVSNGVSTIDIGTFTQLNGVLTAVFNQNATAARIQEFGNTRLYISNSYQPLTNNETETREISVLFANGRTADYSGTPYTVNGEPVTINGISQQAPIPVVKDFTITGNNDSPTLTSSVSTNNPAAFTIYDNRSNSLDPSLDQIAGFVSASGIRAGTNPDDPGEIHLVRGTDVDISHTSLGIYVYSMSSSGGTWQVSLNNGVTWASLSTGVHYANSAYIRFLQSPDQVATSINSPQLSYGASDGIAAGGSRLLTLTWQPTDASLVPNLQDINNPRFLVDAVEIISGGTAPVFKTNTFSTKNPIDRIIVGLGLPAFVSKFDNLSTQNEHGNALGTNFDGAGNVITGLSVSRPADIADALGNATTETGPVVALLWNSNVGTGNPARMELWVDYRIEGPRDPKLVAIFGGTNFDNLGDVESFGWQDFLIVNNAVPAAGTTLGDESASTEQVIFGHQGDDTINGGKGADILVGGSGNDVINSGAGRDVVYGGAGNDTIHLGSGGDFADGGAGDDTIYSGLGNDLIIGNAGDDTIYLSPDRGEGTAGSATINSAGAAVGDDRTITLGNFTVLAGATYSVSIGNAAKAASVAIAGLTTNAVNSIANFNLQLNGVSLAADFSSVTDLNSLTIAINSIVGISASFSGFTLTITADDTSKTLSLSGASVFTTSGNAAVGTGGATIIPPKAAMTDFTTFSYTATEADAVTGVNAVATGLAAAINANSAYTASASTATVTVTEGAGQMPIRFDAPLSGSDTLVLGIDAAQNGFDVIHGFDVGALEWGGDRLMFVDFSPSMTDTTLIKGALTNADLRGTGLFAEKMGAEGTIGANTGFVLFNADLGDFRLEGNFDSNTAKSIIDLAAEALVGESAGDVLYFLGSDGVDAVLARVSYTGENAAEVALLAQFAGMTVADINNFTNENLVNFGLIV